MKILLINEYVESRGAEQIVKEQLEILKCKGHEVNCICFSYSPQEKKKEIDKSYTIIPIPKIGKILFLPHIYFKLRRYLHHFSPDVVILHNIYSSPLTVYKSLDGYNVCQVVHDYKIVCPTSFSILRNKHNAICTGYKHNSCLENCSDSTRDYIKLKIRLFIVQLNERLRKKYVKLLLAPSSRLHNVLLQYGYKSLLLNNPITVDKPPRYKASFEETRKILYVGGLNYEKGILPFIEKMLSKTQCLLDIYGGTTKGCYADRLLDLIRNNSERIKYFGNINHEDLMRKMPNYDFVVVPSLWVDNYPTIILESMANSVCVIASNRGGAVDLLSDERGILFSWDDEKSILKCLSDIVSMSVEKYNKIVSKAYEYVCRNNSYEVYYNQLLKAISCLKTIKNNY